MSTSLDEELAVSLAARQGSPTRVLTAGQTPRTRVDGASVINLCSNNYLGFATHPQLVEAASEALLEFGAGVASARSFAGTTPLHERLEARLAEFKGVEGAITFGSGYTANLGTLAAIAGGGDLTVSDELNHASIIDGLRLSNAERTVFPHADVGALDEILQGARDAERPGPRRRHILVVTDGVFSMDGDIAPLADICGVAERYGATVMVDDAHGTGVLGEGRGSVHHFNAQGRVHVQTGTFSKAFGTVGGFACGSVVLRDYLRVTARPYFYSTAHPPHVVAANLAAIDLLEKEPHRVRRLWENATYFRARLRSSGFDTGRSETPIIPVIVGDDSVAIQFGRRLFEEGVFVQPVAYPSVPRGKARIRTIVTSEHSSADLDACLAAIELVGRETGVI